MNFSFIGNTVAVSGLLAATAIPLLNSAEAANPDQSGLIVERITLDNYKLFSSVRRRSLSSFKCENSDYQNMIVCNKETITRQLRNRLTITFQQDLGSLWYIFTYQSNRFVSLASKFTNDVMRISRSIGPPRQHIVVQLPGDQHQSHLVYWGLIDLIQLSEEDRLKLLSGIPTGKGYLVDYSLSLRYSAEQNYPVYSLTGNPGLILNYRVDNDGT